MFGGVLLTAVGGENVTFGESDSALCEMAFFRESEANKN
jgi:hypothetical protein